MKILVVSDKFKGTMTSRQAGECIARGLYQAAKPWQIPLQVQVVPVADGGDGMLDAIAAQVPVKRLQTESYDPLMRPMMADFLLSTDGTCAYIEMARTNGLWLLDPGQRDPLRTTTYGLGELLRYVVVKLRVKRVVIGLGGSATNDGGVGLLQALGYRFDADGSLEEDVAAFLSSIRGLDDQYVSRICPGLDEVSLEIACDVTNPLLGPSGATRVFGKQKGGSPVALERLEAGMQHWAGVAADYLGFDGSCVPGVGAAGGVGFALCGFLQGKMRRGWEFLAEFADLEQKIQQVDWVITGEGSFDAQSLQGKLPYGIATLCAKHGKPLDVFCGRTLVEESTYRAVGIRAVHSLREVERRSDVCLRFGDQLLEFLVSRKFSDLFRSYNDPKTP